QVEFEHVTFGYDTREVLHDINFSAAPGEFIALVGPSGSGKTTLASLIPRFYEPSAGRVLLDGRDASKYKLAALRQQISLVLQESIVLSGSIRDTLRYGRLDANNAAIEAAARAANAHEFIQALPRGYDTELGEAGIGLSGGQRQRLSMARAFLKDAPILILDEPTAALDAATEAELLVLQERVMEGRPSIVVAHRPRLLEGCDLRLRVESGALVTHTRAASSPRVS